MSVKSSDAIIFDDFLRARKSRRFDTSRLNESSAKQLDWYATRAREMLASPSAIATYPRLPEIHFDWIDSSTVNASAFRHKGRYFIGVNFGTVYVFNLLFTRMFSDPRILQWIGDPTQESVNESPLPAWRADSEYLHRAGASSRLPKNQVRQDFCQLIEQAAMDFVMWHEMTHIAHGHVDYHKKRFGFGLLQEVEGRKMTSEAFMTRQVLEVYADGGAVSSGVGTIHLKMTDASKKPHEVFEQFYREPTQAVFNWAFAMSAFFRLLGDTPFAGKNLSKLLYPPRRVRQVLALKLAALYVAERWDRDLAGPCFQACISASAALEEAFEIATGQPRAVVGLKDAWGEAAAKHIDARVLTHWHKRIRNDLINGRFAFGPLPG